LLARTSPAGESRRYFSHVIVMTEQTQETLQPSSVEELKSIIRDANRVSFMGREEPSKILSGAEGLAPPIETECSSTHISLSKFNRILEYQPDEYTITVEAGAKLRDVADALSEHGQYLPFDPPFAKEDLSIGSIIARGLSGPGACRFGILRDFILGVTFVDGLGERIRTGGKVVKNAAGFDIPKLMCGTWGSLGAITEASFKVFPIAPEYRTLVLPITNFDAGHTAFISLGRSQFTLDVLDLRHDGHLYIKLGGQPGSMDNRIAALETHLDAQGETPEDAFWDPSVALSQFPEAGSLVKVATSPTSLPALDAALKPNEPSRRYSIGGYVAWIHWDEQLEALHHILSGLGLSGQVVSGPKASTMIGNQSQAAFFTKIKSAFDPEGKFLELYS